MTDEQFNKDLQIKQESIVKGKIKKDHILDLREDVYEVFAISEFKH